MELHGYFRSSASYRVRIALNLKGLQYDYHPVNLLTGGQLAADYKKLNPQGLVPAVIDNGNVLTQSLAIIEWLEELHPQKALLPGDALARAKVRALSYNIACDIQPLQNLRVLKYLQSGLSISDEQKTDWIKHWIHNGFVALEQQLDPKPFAAGGKPGLFECCLMPQIYNAERFGMDMADYPALNSIAKACSVLAEFESARPENQPDSTL